MAIQMRRGLRKDFDPNKMLPGEWAVSIDSVTSNQIVWMCFAAGICKRMGTYEDFQAQIAEATKDIRDSYVEDFNEIKADIELMSNAVSSDKEEILIIKSDIVDKYLPQMQEYAEMAESAALSSENFASNAENSATLSKSYSVGGTGKRENEDSDNAKYYYEQTKQISQGINGIVPMGTVNFANLPTSDIVKNAMYNVSDAFVSDERFNDGGGVSYGAGNNVIWTAEGKWDVTASSSVTGIKGEAEDTFRQGNVTITAENIGLGNVNNTSDADKPISDATKDALDELSGKIDENAEDLQGRINAINSNLETVITENSNAYLDFSIIKNAYQFTIVVNASNKTGFASGQSYNIGNVGFTLKKSLNKTIFIKDGVTATLGIGSGGAVNLTCHSVVTAGTWLMFNETYTI